VHVACVAPPPGERLVDGDTGEPGRKPGTPLELVQMLVRTDVCILHHVLRFLVAAGDGSDRAIDALVVAPHDDLEEPVGSGTDARDDVLVGQVVTVLQRANDLRVHLDLLDSPSRYRVARGE